LAEFEAADLFVDFGFGAVHEETAENVGGFFFARNHDAGAGPGEAALALLDVDAEGEGLDAGEVADAFANVLVEGNGVAETAARGVRSGGEEAVVGRMAAVDVGMRDAAEDGEIVAMFFEKLEVGREFVIGAGGLREEMMRENAEVIADAEEAAWLAAGGCGGVELGGDGAGEGWAHGVQERERKGDAGAAEEGATREGGFG
jgi:hypothetical protein